MNKANRDAAWKETGGRRSSSGPALLHPMYVKDYTKETTIELTEADKGFGNTLYKTPFTKLYYLKFD